MPHPESRRFRLSMPVAIAMLCAAILLPTAAAIAPATALAAATEKAAACGVNLRNKPHTTAKLRTSIKTDTRVTVVATVTGGRWKATCAGRAVKGTSWYRISHINGKSVSSLFGRSYVYGASGLFKAYVPPTITKYAACNTNLRTGASTSTESKVVIPTDTKVTITTTVTGGDWSTTCAGNAVSGSSWYRVSAIDGKSTKALYGVDYVHGATGLFKSTAGTTTPTPTPTPTPAPNGRTEGIDISHWQGTINWTSVAAAGKRFAFMKASEDTWYVDPTYPTNRAQAKANGLYVGAYHFAQPNATAGSAVAQADHFVATAGPVSGELLPVLDLERTGGLTNAQLITWVQTYLGRIEQRLGVKGIIYCSPNFWRTNMNDTTWFAQNGYDILWIAHWTTSSAPTVPAGGWGGDGWTFWQYTSDGSVPGISGRVDLNRYNGTDFTRVLIP